MKTWICAVCTALLLVLALAGCRQEGNEPSAGSTGGAAGGRADRGAARNAPGAAE